MSVLTLDKGGGGKKNKFSNCVKDISGTILNFFSTKEYYNDEMGVDTRRPKTRVEEGTGEIPKLEQENAEKESQRLKKNNN